MQHLGLSWPQEYLLGRYWCETGAGLQGVAGCCGLWKPGRLLGLTIHLRVFFCASAPLPRLCLPLCLQLFGFFRIKAGAQRSCLWLQWMTLQLGYKERRPPSRPPGPLPAALCPKGSCLFRFPVGGICVFVGWTGRVEGQEMELKRGRRMCLNSLLWPFKPLLSGLM